MKVYAQLRKVLQVFCQEKVPVIVLKGALLAELVYQHIGLRTMDDVDLLVSKQDLGKAELFSSNWASAPMKPTDLKIGIKSTITTWCPMFHLMVQR